MQFFRLEFFFETIRKKPEIWRFFGGLFFLEITSLRTQYEGENREVIIWDVKSLQALKVDNFVWKDFDFVVSEVKDFELVGHGVYVFTRHLIDAVEAHMQLLQMLAVLELGQTL